MSEALMIALWVVAGVGMAGFFAWTVWGLPARLADAIASTPLAVLVAVAVAALGVFCVVTYL